MQLHTTIIKKLQNHVMSLGDLHTHTLVSLPTLRKAIQELTDHNWIRVVGQGDANGGRPAMLFGLDGSTYAIVGVHLQLPGVRLIVSDLAGNVLDEREAFKQRQPNPEEVVQIILEYVHEMQSTLHERTILGVGIAAPGFIDPDTGAIISIGRVTGWDAFPICQRLREPLNLLIEIANDVDCMAFAEFQYAQKSFARNLAYVGFDEGVKVSLFLNNELYKGSFGNAGLVVSRLLRVGSLDVSPEEQQRLLTISGLNEAFVEAVQQLPPVEQASYEAILHADNRARFEYIFANAESDDAICQMIGERACEVLAAAIVNIIYIIQPDEIVIGGMLSLIPERVFASLRGKIRQQLPTLFANQVRIEKARLLSPNISALGANFHFLDHYLSKTHFELAPTQV